MCTEKTTPSDTFWWHFCIFQGAWKGGGIFQFAEMGNIVVALSDTFCNQWGIPKGNWLPVFLSSEKPLFCNATWYFPESIFELLKFYFMMQKNIQHGPISFLLRSANLINTSNFSKWRSWLKEFARSFVRPPILIGRQVQLIALSFFFPMIQMHIFKLLLHDIALHCCTFNTIHYRV